MLDNVLFNVLFTCARRITMLSQTIWIPFAKEEIFGSYKEITVAKKDMESVIF